MGVDIGGQETARRPNPVRQPTRDRARSRPDFQTTFAGSDQEVVDVDKHVVPKERVRLETDVETREVTVDEDVRKERIEMDNDDTKR